MNLEIDILKFLFSLVIVFHHWHKMPHGYLAVEFFFLCSGFFMAKSAVGNNTKLTGGGYVMKSIARITPYLGAGIIISLLWHVIFYKWSLKTFILNSFLSVGELLNVQMFGFTPIFCATGVAWYLSALLTAKAIYFPVIHKASQKNKYAPIPPFALIALFVYGWLCHEYNSLNAGAWTGFAYVGMLRGLGGTALGVLCFYLADFLRHCHFRNGARFALTLIALCLYSVSVLYMKNPEPSYLDFHIIFFIFIATSIVCSEIGIETSFVNKVRCSFFRKASVCIYFSHFYVVQYFEMLYPGLSHLISSILIITQIIVCSLLNYLLAYLFRIGGRSFLKLIIKETN